MAEKGRGRGARGVKGRKGRRMDLVRHKVGY